MPSIYLLLLFYFVYWMKLEAALQMCSMEAIHRKIYKSYMNIWFENNSKNNKTTILYWVFIIAETMLNAWHRVPPEEKPHNSSMKQGGVSYPDFPVRKTSLKRFSSRTSQIVVFEHRTTLDLWKLIFCWEENCGSYLQRRAQQRSSSLTIYDWDRFEKA